MSLATKQQFKEILIKDIPLCFKSINHCSFKFVLHFGWIF